MNTIILTKIKFKKDKEKIQNIVTTYGFKEINKNTYIGKISQKENEEIKTNLEKTTQSSDTIILIQLCEGCYNKINQYGKIINLEEEKYVIL